MKYKYNILEYHMVIAEYSALLRLRHSQIANVYMKMNMVS